MDENNNFNPIPEQDIPAAQSAEPVYLDNAAQAPVQQPVYAQQPVEAPAQPVYLDNAAQAPIQQPIYAQQPVEAPAQQPVFFQDPGYYAHPQGVSPKSRRLALIFAIVFGPLGINRFYLGNVDVARFVLTLVGYTVLCFSGFIVPFFIGSGLLVYPMICAIKDIIATAKGQMTDGQGLVVKNW